MILIRKLFLWPTNYVGK